MSNRCISALLPLSLLLLWGCAGSPTLYVLTPSTVTTPPAKKQGLVIGVGPIQFPGELDRPQLVTRNGVESNSLAIWEQDRWAHRLDKHFGATLSDNLASLLGAEEVLHYPWGQRQQVDYQIEVDVRRFDACPGQESVLEARWRIVGPKDRELYRPEPAMFRATTALEGSDLKIAVSGLSDSLSQLSRAVATQIVELESAALEGRLAPGVSEDGEVSAAGSSLRTTEAELMQDVRSRLDRIERVRRRLDSEFESLEKVLEEWETRDSRKP